MSVKLLYCRYQYCEDPRELIEEKTSVGRSTYSGYGSWLLLLWLRGEKPCVRTQRRGM